ncbi:MAG: hypothetical protein WCB57_08715 [Pseudonocardiaceae bacterium]
MTAPGEPVPTLELPSDRLMQWSQMALLLAAQLAQRREQLDRLAWSDEEHAARAHDLTERREATTEPAVRAMTTDEIAHWPTSGSDTATGTTGPVTAEVAPLGERWALHATARVDDTVSPVWVSCRDEHTARGLASEILARGEPEAVHRLAGHLQLAERVTAQHAQTQASAPPTDRDAMATHIRSAWPTEAAAAALNCRAWPTLADKLAAAQHNGHDLTALLNRVNTSRIPTARKPAAFASWLLDQATPRPTQDGGQVPPPEQTSADRHPHHDQIRSWADQLDPASMIDRAGALGVVGYCGTPVDTRLVTRFPDLLDDAAHDEAKAAAAEALAAERERSAAAHLATVDDPTTPQREDLDGQALAERDLHEAAAAHATAAESHGAAHAAVARANVTLTAPGPATTAQATGQVTPPPRPQPVTPTRTLRRTR